MEKINRSNVNSSQVKAQDFPKSGFDLSYKSRIDFVLGHLHPTGYQYVMPADKFSGSNDSKLTFNRLVVPEISDVEVSQHNFFVPFRSIDTTFIKGIVPTELNGMSSTWRTPSFTLANLISHYLHFEDENQHTIIDFLADIAAQRYESAAEYQTWISSIRSFFGGILQDVVGNPYLYNDDYMEDVASYMVSVPFPADYSSTQDIRDIYKAALTAYLRPFFGEGSLLDLLGYNYLRDLDISILADRLSTHSWSNDLAIPSEMFLFITDNIDSVPQCEYALRAYYAIWYEWYRDDNLEKRSANLPDWRDFGSVSILSDDLTFLSLLVPRIRSWQKDMFVGSMPDDISRHVYAPILAADSENQRSVDVLRDAFQYEEAETRSGATYQSNNFVNAVAYDLNYRNPSTGSNVTVHCPIPKAINDSLSTLSASIRDFPAFSLDLRDLRKSQMLERYLKRNFYFGDEYQDRMLAHYGSKISDNSIRRPHLLSSSVDMVNPTQQVANVGTEQTPAGTRTAIASAQGGNDGYEFFAEEFGIVINILSVMPRAQYAGICPQNLLSQMTDFPLPEFANNNDEFGRVMEVATSGLAKSNVYDLGMFGHYPYAHAWRSRVDEVHGTWLSSKQNWTFRRFFGLDEENTSPKLNYMFIHCRPNLGMFAKTIRLEGQGYLTCDHHFYVERVLPTPVDEI